MNIYRSRYHGDNPVGEENICTALDMAVWFGRTERIVINKNVSYGASMLPTTVRRVRVGNIYMYRVFIENTTPGSVTINTGDYVLATASEFPEIVNYEFSAQMGAPLWQRTAAGAISYYSSGALLIQPNGIIMHLANAIGLTSTGIAVVAEATRSQMGEWGNDVTPIAATVKSKTKKSKEVNNA